MASRLLALLIAIATIVAPGAGAFGAARVASETAIGCCGEDCQCDDRCPCVARDERPARADETPAAPTSGRDARAIGAIFLPLSDQLAALMAFDATGRAREPIGSKSPDARAAGRALLAQVSRWTT